MYMYKIHCDMGCIATDKVCNPFTDVDIVYYCIQKYMTSIIINLYCIFHNVSTKDQFINIEITVFSIPKR